MAVYFWVKSLHLLFVIAWMAAVFYLPRILVNMAEAHGEPAVRQRLELMGRRLYRFGHTMFGLAFVCGLALWQGWRLWPTQLPDMVGGGRWIDAKLGLVALLLAYFIVTGRLVKRGMRAALPSSKALRLFNELPVVLLLAVLYLVLAKPF